MKIFVKYSSKQIRRDKVLTGIIPEDASNMIHDPRNKFIKLSSKKVVHWHGLLFCTIPKMFLLMALCRHFLLLKLWTEWWIRENRHSCFCLRVKNIHCLCILDSLFYLAINLHAPFMGENLAGGMSLFFKGAWIICGDWIPSVN